MAEETRLKVEPNLCNDNITIHDDFEDLRNQKDSGDESLANPLIDEVYIKEETSTESGKPNVLVVSRGKSCINCIIAEDDILKTKNKPSVPEKDLYFLKEQNDPLHNESNGLTKREKGGEINKTNGKNCCCYCDYKSSNSNLQKHIFRKHVHMIRSKLSKRRCPHCNYKTHSKYFMKSIRKHVLRKHVGKAQKHLCLQIMKDDDTLKLNLEDKSETEDKGHLSGHIHNNDTNAVKNKTQFFCAHCNCRTYYKNNLATHIVEKHNDIVQTNLTKHCCLFCSYKTYNSTRLKRHIFYTHDDMLNEKTPKKKCPYCDHETLYTNHLERHINRKHPYENLIVKEPQSHSCPHCDYKTSQNCYLQSHMLRRHKDLIADLPRNCRGKKTVALVLNEPKCCPHCNFKTQYNRSFKTHLHRKHTNERNNDKSLINKNATKVLCPHCGVYQSRSYYNKHILLKHLDAVKDKPPELCCSECDFKTYFKDILQRHVLQKHENMVNDKPPKITCTHCDYKSYFKYSILMHIERKHSNQSKYSCAHCTYKTASSGTLKRHVLLMHEETVNNKPPKKICSHCDYETYSNYKLKLHISKKHSDGGVIKRESRHSCPHCDYRTNRKYVLKSHLTKKHNDKVTDISLAQPRTSVDNENAIKVEHTHFSTDIVTEISVELEETSSSSTAIGTDLKSKPADNNSAGNVTEISVEKAHTSMDIETDLKLEHTDNNSAEIVTDISAIGAHSSADIDPEIQVQHTQFSSDIVIDILVEQTQTGTKDEVVLGEQQKHCCPHCEYKSNQKCTLKSHMKRNRNDIVTVNTMEPTQTSSKDSVVLGDQEKHCCPHCEYKTNRRCNLKSHMNRKHNDMVIDNTVELKLISADIVTDNLEVPTQASTKHEAVLGETPKYLRPHCDYKTYNNEKLIGHVRNEHNEKVNNKLVKQTQKEDARGEDEHTLKSSKDEGAIERKSLKNQICPYCGFHCSKGYLRKHLLHLHPDMVQNKPPLLCCLQCDFKTHFKFRLTDHMLGRHANLVENKPSKHCCPYCSYKTYTIGMLKRHTLQKHEDMVNDKPPKRKCPYCDHKTYFIYSLNRHIRLKHPGKNEIVSRKHCCPHCDYKSWSYNHLQWHSCSKNKDGKIRQVSSEQANNNTEANKNEDVLEKPPNHCCQQCNYKTRSHLYLNMHISRKHNAEIKAKRKRNREPKRLCPHCGSHIQSNMFIRHLLSKHPDMVTDKPPMLCCSQCDYKTYYKDVLKRHFLQNHEDMVKDKPPAKICPHCDYKTYFNSCLKRHMGKHTEPSKYSCAHCTYKTSSSGTLRRHGFLMHEELVNDKPPKKICPQCDYETYISYKLKLHMSKKHSVKSVIVKEPPIHSCPHCDYKSLRKYLLKKHIHKKHDDMVTEN